MTDNNDEIFDNDNANLSAEERDQERFRREREDRERWREQDEKLDRDRLRERDDKKARKESKREQERACERQREEDRAHWGDEGERSYGTRRGGGGHALFRRDSAVESDRRPRRFSRGLAALALIGSFLLGGATVGTIDHIADHHGKGKMMSQQRQGYAEDQNGERSGGGQREGRGGVGDNQGTGQGGPGGNQGGWGNQQQRGMNRQDGSQIPGLNGQQNPNTQQQQQKGQNAPSGAPTTGSSTQG